MQVAVRIGAEALQLSSKQTKSLEQYALHFGLIYQIVDDILDEVGTKKELGKMPGSDKKKNKSTYISVCGLGKAIKLSEQEAKKATASLRVFGQKAERLRQLVDFIVGRRS